MPKDVRYAVKRGRKYLVDIHPNETYNPIRSRLQWATGTCRAKLAQSGETNRCISNLILCAAT